MRSALYVDGVVTEKYLWQGRTQLLAVYDGSGSLKSRFLYADARMPVAMETGGQTYYLACDQVGSLRAVANTSGTVVKTITYDSFGNMLEDSNETLAVPFGFAGGLYDADTGLVRFGYRDYDAEVGRWTAKDPIGFGGGDIDLYGYCGGDPVDLIDPYGLKEKPCGKAGWDCWLKCMKNYPGVGTAISLATLGTLGNLKIPGIEWKGVGSPFTSLSRRLGSKGRLAGGAEVVRGSIRNVKYLGWGGTIAAGVSAFGFGYLAGAGIMCVIECSQ